MAEVKETGAPRSKEEAQQELVEKFGMRKTSDFQAALRRGEIEKAGKWFDHIDQNRGNFPQYDSSWLADRRDELSFYSECAGIGESPERDQFVRDLEKNHPRNKREAQMLVELLFGLRYRCLPCGVERKKS